MSAFADSLLLAHSWGWDEILMFAVPVALALGGIRWVERRAATKDPAPDAEAPPESDHPSSA